jgi:hypothetical protein
VSTPQPQACESHTAGNLHTAELLRWERYSYLMEPGNAGAFDNLFDRGPVINCVQFWGSWGPLDWGPVYHERWQVCCCCFPMPRMPRKLRIRPQQFRFVACGKGILSKCLSNEPLEWRVFVLSLLCQFS